MPKASKITLVLSVISLHLEATKGSLLVTLAMKTARIPETTKHS